MTDPTTPATPPPAHGPDAPHAGAREERPMPPPERPIPRGCHPLVFGVVMGTIQFALTLYFVGRC